MDLDALEAVVPGSIRCADRLRGAGYARLELGEHLSGRLVWNRGFSAVAADWRTREPDGDGRHPRVPNLGMKLVRWYEDRGRLDDAVDLMKFIGGMEALEDFAERRFVDLVMTKWLKGFDGASLPAVGGARTYTAVAILSALQAHPLVRDDEGAAARLECVLGALELRLGDGDARERLGVITQILITLALLDRWEDSPALDAQAIDAVDEAVAQGGLERAAAARVLTLVGSLALIRGNIVSARTALTRALAASTTDPGTWSLAAVATSVLEGYLGDFLFDRKVDRRKLIESQMPDALAGAFADEWLVVVRLARSWDAVWRGDLDGGLDELTELTQERERALVQPMVTWCYGLQMLLTGDAEGARALHAEVRRRLDARTGDSPPSERFALGSVLASVATGRLGEALRMAHLRRDGQGLLDRATKAVIAIASGCEGGVRMEWGKEGDTLARLSPRVRTLRACLCIAEDLRSGRAPQASEALRGLTATAAPQDLVLALRVMSREDALRVLHLVEARLAAPPTFRELVEREAKEGPHVLVENLVHVDLSPAELAVLDAARQGLSNQGIADALFLSVNTVKTHLRSIYRRFGVRTRQDALSMAEELGVFRPR